MSYDYYLQKPQMEARMGIVEDLTKMQNDVLEAINNLSAEELNRPNTIGKWSARDVVMHMAMWDGEALKALSIWRTGHDYDWTYADEYLKINECWHQVLKKMSEKQAIQMYNLVRAALIADISSISDNIWESRGGVPNWLAGIAIKHNQWHLEKLQAYKKLLKG
jgi:hypothetical protein